MAFFILARCGNWKQASFNNQTNLLFWHEILLNFFFFFLRFRNIVTRAFMSPPSNTWTCSSLLDPHQIVEILALEKQGLQVFNRLEVWLLLSKSSRPMAYRWLVLQQGIYPVILRLRTRKVFNSPLRGRAAIRIWECTVLWTNLKVCTKICMLKFEWSIYHILLCYSQAII